jgi:uncharacterized protein (DUF58 family)
VNGTAGEMLSARFAPAPPDCPANAVEDRGALVPETVSAQAVPFKKFGVAFGNRVFLLLLIGIAWLIPAFADKRFVAAMFAWDVLILLFWAIDLATLPRPWQLTVIRGWSAPVALSVESKPSLTVINASNRTIHLKVLDEIPVALRGEAAQIEMSVPAQLSARAEYSILPTKRGRLALQNVYLKYQSPLRIAERWARAPLAQTVLVYPNLDEAKRHSIYLVRSRQIEMEKRYTCLRGMGRSFESLREYRDGDEFRDICWTATARRGKLVTRLYEIERSQTIWTVLDCGRLMRTRVSGLSKLDYAVNASLAVAQVALYSGDRVGLLAYGRSIRQRVPAARGSAHLMQITRQLGLVSEEEAEADHLLAASRLLTDQKRRSLVIWITELAETAMTPEVMEAAFTLVRRHLVLFVVIGQPDMSELAAQRPQNAKQMYEIAAAQEILHRRELLLARMRERGALALETTSSKLSTAVVNSYLEVKHRSQL